MRIARNRQPTLEEPWIDCTHAKELEAVSRILDDNPGLSELVAGDVGQAAEGRKVSYGMTGEQILRALVVKQMNGYSYEELAFHLLDSRSYRTLCRIGITDSSPSKSTLAENIKRIRPETLEQINRMLAAYATRMGVESGQKVRIDSTPVEANVHHPDDSTLLWDCIRVLTRLMDSARELVGSAITFPNRTRRAKRRVKNILYARNNQRREKPYRDLLKVAAETSKAARNVAEQLREFQAADVVAAVTATGLATQIDDVLACTQNVVDQTRRRVLQGEHVPASEKLFSIFEKHTDILVKGSRNVTYGHKVFLTGGRSSLILDCLVAEGNPADSSYAGPMIDRLKDIYGRVPRQAALDGGFASQENLLDVKQKGVKDVMFNRKRGLEISEMVRSIWVYRRLRDFRAGIEGCISFLKRVFGLDRCTWRSLPSFKSYVWASVVSFNLLVLARHLLT
jgi:IS5 family transposase